MPSAASLARSPTLWIAVTLVVAGAAAAAVRARGPMVHTVPVVRKDLEQHVVASGRVWVPTRVQVAAQIPGLVVAVAVVEGQHVAAGDLLVQIDDSEARANVEQAKGAVAQAAARVEQLRRVGAIVATEALRQSDASLERAESDLARVEKLAATGAIASVELENARRSAEVARAQRNAAAAQQIAAAPLGADSRVALTALLQAQAQLAGANVRLGQTRIVALQEAVVLGRSVEPGDTVQPSKPLLILAAGGSAELVVQPDERNLAALKLGQKARASADAYPQQAFDAEVSYIAPSIDPQRGSIEVRLRVPSAPTFLKPDMTVSIDLTVASRTKVLTLPSDVVQGLATPSPWVFAVEGGRLVRRDLQLGIRGEGTVEITAGVEEHAEIAGREARLLTGGQRVRASREGE